MTCGVQPSTFVMLGEYSGRSGTNVPVTFGVCCKEGDFHSSMVPYWGGVARPAQVNVLRRHDDGTIRHALVTFIIPSLAAGAVEQRIDIVSGTPLTPSPNFSITAEELQHALYQDEVDWTDGVTPVGTWKSSVNSTTALALIDNATVQDPAATSVAGFTRIVFGPLLCEYEGWVPMLDVNNNPHPWMKTLLRVRLYSNWHGARIDYAVENCPWPSSATTWTEGTNYGELAFSAVRLNVGTPEVERYKYRGYFTYKTTNRTANPTAWIVSHSSRYRVVAWAGSTSDPYNGEPPKVYTVQDLQYLADNHFVAKYDYTNPLTTADVATRGVNYTGYDVDSSGGIYHDPTWDAFLLANPYGGPGLWYPSKQAMGASGASAGIGALPEWDVVLANSLGATNRGLAWRIALVGACNSPAAYASGASNKRIHHRDPFNPDVPGALMWCVQATSKFTTAPSRDTYKNAQVDFGHKPHFSYFMYLCTGDRFMLDEMAWWALHSLWYVDSAYDSRTSIKNPLLMDQDRYAAWGCRDNTDYVFICPDNTYKLVISCKAGVVYHKDYCNLGLDNSLAYWAESFNRSETTRPLHNPHGSYHAYVTNFNNTDARLSPWGVQHSSGRTGLPFTASLSIWQAGWWQWSLWNCWKKLKKATAWDNFDWYAQFYVYVFVDPSVDPQYHTRIGYNGIPYGGPRSWVYYGPDNVVVDWGALGVRKDGTTFERRILCAQAYDFPVCDIKMKLHDFPSGPTQVLIPQTNWYVANGAWRQFDNLGQCAWTYAVAIPQQYDDATDKIPGTNTSCGSTGPDDRNPCFCTSKRGYPSPYYDTGGDGAFPAVPDDWRVCGYPGYTFYDTCTFGGGVFSDANYCFGLAHACLAEAGIPGADQYIYNYYHTKTQNTVQGFLGYCFIK